MIIFDEAHSQFVAYLSGEDRADSTILAYGKDIEQMLNHINDTFDKTHVHHIETEHIKSFLESLENEQYTKKSISRKINSIKTFFRFLKLNDYVIEDPSSVISHPKFEIPAPRILSETEYRALRDAARDDVRTHAIIELLLQSGIRIGELSEVVISDITIDESQEQGVLNIEGSRTTLARRIPLNKAAVLAIVRYLNERPEAEAPHVFVTRTGKPLLVRNIRASIDRYYKKAGIENAKVNDLRHTWIAHHIKRGTSLVMLSKLAGHKRLATTEKYLEFTDGGENNSIHLEEL
ncbi:tyrosine-type recombinase/integrase [bacterium]|uniref:Tyrosine recombinase XerC n=2 Tax=Katanobacteria TaxID=422282 RepID=A0A2M7X0X0_UNCKA|nr:tyrosine-type recombinase/integrase [bacterium]PIP56713.1 MAG: hypothetical protein COX05_01700 [candidate division WWE3 bacterium CG22_combo_CG10-13_8_21_14_all_39_12]PJA39820.1 MAG: hypothetical protein CO179_04365 [candidate division WWE3 bacterium CG_4_9_14_3_um_filter_39_7]